MIRIERSMVHSEAVMLSGEGSLESQRGFDAQHLGRVAEQTFNDLLFIWTANAGALASARLEPDVQKIDLQSSIPSLWPSLPHIPFHWQVKASAKALTNIPASKSPLNTDSFRLKVGQKAITGLMDHSRVTSPLYLVVAIQKTPGLQPHEVLQQRPEDRFNWYALDLVQYFNKLKAAAPSEYIFIPIYNVLNFGVFSLLWAARWTEDFFAPLSSPQIVGNDGLQRAISKVFNPEGNMLVAREYGWKFLTQVIPSFSRQVDRDIYASLSLRLGIGSALGIIRHQLYAAGDDIDEILAYCPESLSGFSCLWLFSRSYYDFMTISAELSHAGHPGFKSTRLLPLPGASFDETPSLLRAVLWYVRLLYRALKTTVLIVERPENGAGDDHSYYGGGIGYFPWLQMDQNDASWVITSESKGDQSLHLDFLRQYHSNFLLGSDTGILEFAREARLDPDDLKLPPVCPRHLFPLESVFVRHPHELFANRSGAIALPFTM
jgi:hypothetical protein